MSPARYEIFFILLKLTQSLKGNSRMEAGFEYSTVALRVVGGDEKESLGSRVPWDLDPKMNALAL
jgi:hypothetical protein